MANRGRGEERSHRGTETQRHRGGLLLLCRHTKRQQENEMLFILLPGAILIRTQAREVELASVSLCLCGSLFLLQTGRGRRRPATRLMPWRRAGTLKLIIRPSGWPVMLR